VFRASTDPHSKRAALRAMLEAGEALRAAAVAYVEALGNLPGDLSTHGLHAEVDGVDDDGVNGLVDKLADLLCVPDDSELRRTVPTRKAAREALEHADKIAASELDDVVERLTGVVDARVTPALAGVERELLRDFACPARPAHSKKR
jgi:hypothetical protein